MLADIQKDTKIRMGKSVDSLRHELAKIRTGRAHPRLLEHVHVDYYGSDVPLNQASNIAIEDSRTLTVTPWEKAMVKPIEKAILTSDLGLNPSTSGQVIRIPLPPLTEERRKELGRVVHQEGENTKIAIRNIRRDANHHIKEMLKEKMISEDDDRKAEIEIQQLTDKFVTSVGELVVEKEQELLDF